MIVARRALPIGILLLAGCATNGGLRRVETQVAVLRVETARRDSARAAELDRIIALQDRMLDSLLHTQQAIHAFRSATVADLAEIARQLVQIQELTGQSQQRLSELRSDLEARIQASLLAVPPVVPGGEGDTTAMSPMLMPSANQMYQAAIMQFRRGSLGTARLGFHEFLKAWPNDGQVPDALYHIGETWATENPDSAIAYHSQVVDRYRNSPRAPTSLYKIGQAAEARNDPRAARAAYERLIREYPRAADVPLAQDRLNALRP